MATVPLPLGTVSSLYPGITRMLANRPIPAATMAENIRKAVLELTEDYTIPLLQITGPTVQLVPFQNTYNISYFMTLADAASTSGVNEFNKIESFFIYVSTTSVPVVNQTQNAQSGYNLKYKTIETLETLINETTIPTNWSRFGGQIIISATPDLAYYLYMRYRKMHPFPNAGLATAGNDFILMPYSWQDIVEIAATQRCAQELRLYDMAKEMHDNLYGDPTFQRTGGAEGRPGLIFKRTSQREQDQTTSCATAKLRISTYMR